MRRWYSAVAVLVLAAGLAGCGDELQPDEADLPADAAQPAPFTEPTLDTAALPPEPTSQDVQVTLTEWTVVADRDDVSGGAVTFVTRNDGTMPHALRVSGGSVDNASDPIDPGEEVRISMSLGAGTYELSCPIDDHAIQGMRATLVVR